MADSGEIASRQQCCHNTGIINQQHWRSARDFSKDVSQSSGIMSSLTIPTGDQVAWAHSEHGSVIACASEDGMATIWQQLHTSNKQDHSWIQHATLTRSMKPITSLQFAPVQLGPQLAVASSDGFARFYEASAVLNADNWQLCNELQVRCFADQILF